MKLRKIIKVSAILALGLSTLNAASNHIGYQGIAFDDGSALIEQNISLRFTVYESNGSTLVYQETKTGIKTTDKGFFSYKIGSGVKSSSSPLWTSINWNDNYKLKVEIDKNNGTSFVNLGTQDLISVAYAKKSEVSASAIKLSNPRIISLGGDLSGNVSFDGSSNITLNAQVANNSHTHTISNITNLQTQLNSKLSTTANAVSATKLQTARNINGRAFDGTANINIEPFMSADNSTNANRYLTFSDNSTSAYKRLKTDSNLYYNPYSNTLYASIFNGNLSGNATTASRLQTSRSINGKLFNGSANMTVEPYIQADNTTNSIKYLTFSDSSTAGYKRIKTDSNLQYNPYTNTLYATSFNGKATSAGTLTGLTASVAELNKIDGYSGNYVELNYLDSLHNTGVTSSEFDYLDGVTSSIQTQLNSKMANKTIYDQDNMSSNSNTALATQQSIKAYVDNKVASVSSSGSYLPLSGGTLTGDLKINAGKYISNSTNTSTRDIFGWRGDNQFRLYLNNTDRYLSTELGSLIVNDGSKDIDFRVESNTDENMLFVNGGTNKVGIGTNIPAYTLDVDGTLGADSINIGGTTATHIYDEDSMTSNSATALATQQSIKTYVDNRISSHSHSSYLSKSGGTVSGNVRVNSLTIGTSTPSKGLIHIGSSKSTTISTSRYVYFNYNSHTDNKLKTEYKSLSSHNTSIYAKDSIVSDGSFISISDKRVKKDITPIKNSLETLEKLNPVHYLKKDEIENGSRRHYGFIAQELEKVLPEAVNTSKGEVPILKPFDKVEFEDGITYTILVKKADEVKEQKYTTKDKRPKGEIIVKSKEVDDLKSVTYDMVFTLAVDAIQEQQEEIESLKSQLDAIKKALKTSGISIK